MGRNIQLYGSLLALLFVCGCSTPALDPNVQDARPDSPLLLIYRYPAYPVPGQRLIHGVVAAVLPDGTIVRAKSPSDIGQAYVRGHLSPQQIDELRAFIDNSGLLKIESNIYAPPDAAIEDFIFLSNGRLRKWTHSPGFENTTNSAETIPAITAIENYLFKIVPSHVVDEPAEKWNQFHKDWWN